MNESTAQDLLSASHKGVLITVRRDGRPQSSNIMYAFSDGVARVSVTEDRAKTRNLRRDPRAVLHVSDPSFWRYCSASGVAELSETTREPGDAIGQELLDLYNTISPEPHPDPAEFFDAMVAERRLIVRFTPTSFAGQG